MAKEELKEIEDFAKTLKPMPLGDLIALLIDVKIAPLDPSETLSDKAIRGLRLKEIQNEISRRQTDRKASEPAPLTRGVSSLGKLF